MLRRARGPQSPDATRIAIRIGVPSSKGRFDLDPRIQTPRAAAGYQRLTFAPVVGQEIWVRDGATRAFHDPDV